MKIEEMNRWLKRFQASPVAVTPYMLTDLSVIRNNCLTFKRVFPGVGLFYAMKAFADKEVLQAVNELVDGFDAASMQEIKTLLELGIAPARIAFSNPVKAEAAIMEAAVSGVSKFAFQSGPELEKISRAAPGAEVYVRVKMDDAHSAVPLSVKYGCRQDEVVSLLQQAERLGLKAIGITFHIGSQQTGLEEWKKAIIRSQELLKEVQAAGIDARVINVGGGFPAQYGSDDPAIEAVGQVAMPAITSMPDFTYMAEPGRFIVANSSAIVASIIGREERGERTWIYLDVGTFQAFVGALRFDPFPYPPLSIRHLQHPHVAKTKSFILTGPSCDSHDIITATAELPEDIAVGDMLLFPNTGAYTVVYGSNFNGFPIPKRYFLNEHGN